MNLHAHSTYTGYGGGGGGGGVYKHEATIVKYDDGMTIDVNGGARGARKREDCPHAGGVHDSDCNYWVTVKSGFAGSVGKVFLVSSLSFVSYLIDVFVSSHLHMSPTIPL